MNTSIVIPLSRADRWNHIELKYTLRGIEKHLSGYGDIFIIGAYPDWMKGGVHIPATDNEMVYDKQRNIFRKIMVACGDERVTERFLFMNDEHYLLKNYTAADFPYYYEGELHSQPAISDRPVILLQRTLVYHFIKTPRRHSNFIHYQHYR